MVGRSRRDLGRHPEVDEDGIRLLLGGARHGVLPRGRKGHVEAGIREQCAEHQAKALGVIAEQDHWACHHGDPAFPRA